MLSKHQREHIALGIDDEIERAKHLPIQGDVDLRPYLTINNANAGYLKLDQTASQTIVNGTPTLSTMTLGSVLFAGTGGLISQDNSNLFWDDTNKRLGIGKNTPLDVVEIFSSANNGAVIRLTGTAVTAGGESGLEFRGSGGVAGTFAGGFYREQDTNDLWIYTAANGSIPKVKIANTTGDITTVGKIGVGKTPSYPVDVTTTLGATFYGICTAASGGSAGAFQNLYSDDGAAISNNDRLGGFLIGGAKDASHTLGNATAIASYASEDWSSTATGSMVQIETTLNGGTARAAAMAFYNDKSARVMGNLGVATAPTTTSLIIGSKTFTADADSYGANITAILTVDNPAAARTVTGMNFSAKPVITNSSKNIYAYGFSGNTFVDGANVFTQLYGGYARAYSASTATSGQGTLYGFWGQASITSSGTVPNGTAGYFLVQNSTAQGTITTSVGNDIIVRNVDTGGVGAMPTVYGSRITISKSAGALDFTTAYGFYASLANATTSYGVYTTGETKNYHSGNLCIGTTNIGSGAVGTLCIANGTQGAALANAIQLVSEDLSAGNTIPSIETEGTGITGAGISDVAVTTKIAIKVNGAVYYLLATTVGT